MRTAELYGINPALGEGLVNTAGATTTNLPADSNGNDTILNGVLPAAAGGQHQDPDQQPGHRS
jgi:hypothetical protein